MEKADALVFATPIYYYEMSGQMKTMRNNEELLALVQQYHNYSVLGHMDLITR